MEILDGKPIVENKKTIASFFYGSVEKSLGPAIHFTELWNNFNEQYSNVYNIIAYSSYINDTKNFTQINFKLKKVKLLNIRKVRMLILDLQLSYYLLSHRKDIVYFRLSVFNFFSAIVIKLFKIKPIVELNGIVENDLSTMGFPILFNKISKWQSDVIIKSSKGCIAVSDAIATDAKNKGAQNIVTIKNGVSDKFFRHKQNTTSNKIKVAYVGTFTPWDGAADIVELAKHFPEVEFNLYGIGDNVLREKIKSDSPSNVSFPGYVSYNDLPVVYSQHDAGIVLYSQKRNNDVQLSSLKTLEYLASALPIFTTNVKGQEFVSENKIGMNINLENVVNEFRVFLSQLEFFKENINAYRKTMQDEISWKGVAIKTEKFISKLI